jgi:parallel beta-helix repeat protein
VTALSSLHGILVVLIKSEMNAEEIVLKDLSSSTHYRVEVIMKRFLLFYAAFALIIWLGCEKAKSPTSPENLNLAKNEAALADTLAEATSLAAQGQALQKAKRTIKVPDDYATIQAAVNAANPGDKIVVKASGSPYNEVVSFGSPKSDILISAAGQVTLNGRFIVQANNVGIEHFSIKVEAISDGGIFPGHGIYVDAVSGVKLNHNTITGNDRGIFLNGSTNCLLKKNACTGFSGIGIFLVNANENAIVKNTSTGNIRGIEIVNSNNNVIFDNDFSGNNHRGLDINGGDGNKISHNTCNHNAESGILVSPNADNNIIGPKNTANFNGQFGIFIFPGANNNTVIRSRFHCNASGDIRDLGTDTKLINNATGPLPECQ